MIIKTTAYQVGEQVFPTIIEAQKSELLSLVCGNHTPSKEEQPVVDLVVDNILNNADKVVDILTMTPTSKPRARKVHGGKKVRKPKDAPATTPA